MIATLGGFLIRQIRQLQHELAKSPEALLVLGKEVVMDRGDASERIANGSETIGPVEQFGSQLPPGGCSGSMLPVIVLCPVMTEENF